jgi:murein DD-endopeptidase MepM/ murein hydrolase activator NlpD
MRCLRLSTSSIALVRVSACLAGMAVLSGCSSDATRFQSMFTSVQRPAVQPLPAGVDAMATASVQPAAQAPKVGPLINGIPRPLADLGAAARRLFPASNSQPLPAQTPLAQPQPLPAMLPVSSPSPVTVANTPLLAPVAAPQLPSPQPVVAQSAPVLAPVLAPVSVPAANGVTPKLDTSATGAIAPAVPSRQNGWTTDRGTKVVMREGETVYNLSRRFGVPASEILRANGIDKAGSVRSGQELIIPAYHFSQDAGVSAPDANPDTAIAKGSRGTVFDIPDDRAPAPTPRPGDAVAVLPTVPQPKAKGVDSMSVGAVAAAKPANPADNDLASGLPVDQPLMEAGRDGTYKVQPGDSLHAIAKKTGISVGQLRAANGLDAEGRIRVGQTLNLAGTAATAAASDGVDGNVTGKRGSTVTAKSARVDQTTTAAIDPKQADPVKPAAPSTSASAGDLRWPVQGKVETAFRATDNGKPNDGIDIDVAPGTPVKAADGGTVIYSGSGLAEFGNTVLIRHDNGLVTVYGHADQLKVERNQRVNKGDVIAVAGQSGRAAKPKLHFEVRKNSVPVDPMLFLQ